MKGLQRQKFALAGVTRAGSLAAVYRSLNPAFIVETIGRLRDRIQERFPDSGLNKVAAELQQIGDESVARGDWIARPLVPLRIGIGLLVVLIAAVLVLAVGNLRLPMGLQSVGEFVQTVESGVNDLVFVGIAIFFLITIEVRIKRRRALKALHELRALAHIIDMHQLTKDPHIILNPDSATKSSPRRTMTDFELSRYLDYCSEMLSLTGKIAALYVQRFDDPVVLGAVDEIEDLTTGLSRKVWQKIMIINQDRR